MPGLEGLKLGFVGAGAMAEAIMHGLAGAGPRLLASDPLPARRAKAEEYGARVLGDNLALAAEAEVLVLAVKPQQAAAVLAELAAGVRPGQTVLSIVAGLRLAAMAAALPAGVGLIRAMPNTPALIGAGVTGVALAEPGPAGEELARSLLSPLGRVVFLPEGQLDAVTGLSGSGPAYVALFAEALIEAGVKAGLARPIAAELAVQTMLGTSRMLAGGEAPGALRERVTSPGGTTAYGLYALEKGGLRAAVSEAVQAATERARELGSK